MPAKREETKSEAQAPANPLEAVQRAAMSAWQAPFQMASRAAETQASLVDEWRRNLLSMAGHAAVFKTRIQQSGRVSIPDAEREALGLEEGDLVQVVVIPLKKKEK